MNPQFICKTYGEQAWMITPENGSPASIASLLAHAQGYQHKYLIEIIPGFENLTLLFKKRPELPEIKAWLATCPLPKENTQHRRTIELKVDYSGADLDNLSSALGLSTDEVIKRHFSVDYSVKVLGFSPGFPYLDGLDASLHHPRKAVPLIRIPAGSVAIGGSHTGIYSVDSPGGWHIIGHIKEKLFNLEAAHSPELEPSSIFLLHPGDTVRFIPA